MQSQDTKTTKTTGSSGKQKLVGNMDGSTLGVMKKFKEYRIKTEDLLKEIENTLSDFEKSKDSQQLYDRTKEAVKRFSNT